MEAQAQKLDELVSKLDTLAGHKDRDAFASRNGLRRALYTVASRLAKVEQQSAALTIKVKKVLEETCRLERQTKSGSAVFRLVSALLRGLGFVSWAMAGSLVLLLFSWLRLLDPIFRSMGMRNGTLPFDRLIMLYTSGILAMVGVQVVTEGSEHLRKVPSGQPALVMFSHASNLDPFVLTSSTPLGVQWIGKRSLFLLPLFGWAALAAGMVPVNRSNRSKAIASLNAMTSSVAKTARPIGISPEGTRSKTGQLLPAFKKGPFYMREDTKSAVLPVLIIGAFELWPPGQLVPSSGKVTLRYLDPIEGNTKLSRDDVSAELRRRFVDSLETEPMTPRAAGHSLDGADFTHSIVSAALVLFAEYALLKFVRAVLLATGLSSPALFALALAITAIVSGYIVKRY